jgi:hypothetical protein
MFGTFFSKYRRPLFYAVTKVLANHIHDVIAPRRPSISAAKLYRDLCYPPARPVSAPIYRTPEIAPKTPEKAQIARNVEVPFVAKTRVSRPAAVRANGGLRGSSATRWAR